jgi:predicted nucleic acid-binding protein
MTRTYVDADILIAAARGNEELSELAMNILEDGSREFIGSTLQRMETSAPSRFHGYTLQAEFYDEFFARVVEWVPVTNELTQNAHDECLNSGIQAFDALHIAAAAAAGAEEFITAERLTSPIHNARIVRVVSIRT